MSNKQLILVVDDDPDLVDSVSRKLEDNNYRTSKAYDGVEAWKKIRQERPDLVLLDVMMPEKGRLSGLCGTQEGPAVQGHHGRASHSGGG